MKKFTVEKAEEIIRETIHTSAGKKANLPQKPNPECLCQDLNRALLSFQSWHDEWEKLATKQQLVEKLSDTIAKNEKAFKSQQDTGLHLARYEKISPASEVVSVIGRIEVCLEELVEINELLFEIKDQVKGDNHIAFEQKGIKAKTDFVGRILPEVYQKHFGKKPARGYSQHAGKPSGPTTRFISSCLKALDIQMSLETVKSHLAECKKRASE